MLFHRRARVGLPRLSQPSTFAQCGIPSQQCLCVTLVIRARLTSLLMKVCVAVAAKAKSSTAWLAKGHPALVSWRSQPRPSSLLHRTWSTLSGAAVFTEPLGPANSPASTSCKSRPVGAVAAGVAQTPCRLAPALLTPEIILSRSNHKLQKALQPRRQASASWHVFFLLLESISITFKL